MENKTFKVAIVGSRNLKNINLGAYLNVSEISEIISGGAEGVDNSARKFAIENGIDLLEILPDYQRFGRSAPIIRNKKIVDGAEKIIAFWDGKSRGTLSTIKYAEKQNKPFKVIVLTMGTPIENPYLEEIKVL